MEGPPAPAGGPSVRRPYRRGSSRRRSAPGENPAPDRSQHPERIPPAARHRSAHLHHSACCCPFLVHTVHALEPGKTRSSFAASLAVIASEDPLCAESAHGAFPARRTGRRRVPCVGVECRTRVACSGRCLVQPCSGIRPKVSRGNRTRAPVSTVTSELYVAVCGLA